MSVVSHDIVTGRVWCFGDNINTDLMLPNSVNGGAATLDEQARAVFGANRPGWVDEMRPGDVIVGGFSYGIGSNRPAARSLRHLGVACLIVLALAIAIGSGLGSSSAEGDGDAAADALTGSVVSVADGDTFHVDLPTGEETVRVIGIDTPEIAHEERPAACYGPEAATWVREGR